MGIFVIGTVFGGAVGVVCMALCNAAAAADRKMEERKQTESR